jgi:hypothetical protein
MSEQPNQPETPQPQIEKLLIDNPSNFQFHAAYLVYSETFDKVGDAQAKKDLNQNLEDLQSNKIGLETFYVNISRYRHIEQMPRQGGRLTVVTQRKKDWRMKTQRQERIKRHKK